MSLITRGHDVRASETNIVTAHTHLVPTNLKLASAKEVWFGLDGSPTHLSEQELEDSKKLRQEHANVEFWGRGFLEGIYEFSLHDGKFSKLRDLFSGIIIC